MSHSLIIIVLSLLFILIVFIIKKSSKIEKKIEGSFRVIFNEVLYRPSRFKKKVLNNVSFTIEPSEIVAILGPNAAGKSSILKAIAGEIPISSGEIVVGSTHINKPINRLIDGVGIVHQFDDADLIEDLSIAQNIAIRQIIAHSHKPKLFSVPSYWYTDLNSMIGRFSIQLPDSSEIIKYLAGGEKQLLNVCIAIHLEHIKNPCGLLLLDEHTSRLSPKNAKKVMDFTMTEVKKYKITTIMVTHQYTDALTYADRILIIKNGKLTAELNKNESENWNILKVTELIES